MPLDFSALKKTRKNSLDQLSREVEKLNQNTKSGDDNRFWKPEVDKAGNGYAIIRFLPAPKGEDVPFVRIFDHGFQGPGGWYIENSLTTIGQDDPVGKINSRLWNSGIEANKEIARKQKRRLSFLSNIYVVSDPANPANEGKVFLYKYGKKIFEKINEAMHPQFADEEATNPFDLWEGANFKLKIRNFEGYRNYDKSEFDKVGPLKGDDEELEKIWESEHSLSEFLDPKNFKSYDELKRKLEKVLGTRFDDDGEVTLSAPTVEAPPKPVSRAAAPPPMAEKSYSTDTTDVPWSTDDEDEDVAYFKNMIRN
jgi:hypothetical protein